MSLSNNSHDDRSLVEDHDRGLNFDRRRFLGLAAGTGLFLAGCSSSTKTESQTAGLGAPETTVAPTSTIADLAVGDNSVCEVIPQETGGPFPGDGSNGPNVLNATGVVRSDIRSSFGSSTTTAEGTKISVKLAVVSTASGCDSPMAGAAVYIWHCDALGRYSMYSSGAENDNYLRGVQVSDETGSVTFTTIVPGAYPGRWPHMHFEVYPSLAEAVSASGPIATSQLALPAELCQQVYARSGYDASADTLATMSVETDMVFADSFAQQLATVSGTIGSALTASLVVPV